MTTIDLRASAEDLEMRAYNMKVSLNRTGHLWSEDHVIHHESVIEDLLSLAESYRQRLSGLKKQFRLLLSDGSEIDVTIHPKWGVCLRESFLDYSRGYNLSSPEWVQDLDAPTEKEALLAHLQERYTDNRALLLEET